MTFGMMSTGFSKAAIVTSPLLVLLCVLCVCNPAGDFWESVEPPKAQVEAYSTAVLASARTLDSSVYDFVKLNRLIREPQNTVSNLAYVAAGFAIVFSAKRRVSTSFGLACVFLGVGSGLYHASLLPEWRMLDIIGVYAVLFSLLVTASAAIFQHGAELVVPATAWVAAFYTGIHRNDVRVGGLKVLDSKYVVVSCVVLGSALALYAGRMVADRKRYLRYAMTLALTAGLAFFGGVTDRFGGVWAVPEALVQGHSVWHTFGAFALLASYEIFALTGYDRSVFVESSGPNQALEPTSPAVTPRACARAAPAGDVAHL